MQYVVSKDRFFVLVVCAMYAIVIPCKSLTGGSCAQCCHLWNVVARPFHPWPYSILAEQRQMTLPKHRKTGTKAPPQLTLTNLKPRPYQCRSILFLLRPLSHNTNIPATLFGSPSLDIEMCGRKRITTQRRGQKILATGRNISRPLTYFHQ